MRQSLIFRLRSYASSDRGSGQIMRCIGVN